MPSPEAAMRPVRSTALLLLMALASACRPTVNGGEDLDGDGWTVGYDCDDTDPAVYPYATEACNGVDDDCDQRVDEDLLVTAFPDEDGDGFGQDAAAEVCPGTGLASRGGDCDDTDPAIHPGAEEACNGVDDDCDGDVEPGWGTWYTDADADGHGDPATAHAGCEATTGEVATGDDCDDTDPLVHPGADDPCGDGIDTDCDDRDLQCWFGGEYEMGDASAKAYAPGPSFGAGEYLDAGDINGDGIDDVAIPTLYAEGYMGGAYVAYGPLTGAASLEDVGDRITGTRTFASLGRSVGVGDVSGDGVDDLALGAADSTCKEAVFFGPLGGDRDASDAQVTRTGKSNTETGHGSDLADVTGDGFVDLVIGAYEDDEAGAESGAVYVEHGPVTAGTSSAMDSADLVLQGETRGAYAGRYVGAGADMNGDGIGDLLVAAPYATGGAPSSGGAYLVYGGRTGVVSLSTAEAHYLGERASDCAGEQFSMGDLDGDGLGDVVLASMASAGAGAVYVIFGPATGVSFLDDAPAILRGTRSGQGFGLGLDADDVDGDGVDDLLVGARGDNAGGNGSGTAFLFWGPITNGLGPADADAIFVGESTQDNLGAATCLADLDADGLLDVILGAPGDATGGNGGGAIFVQYPGR